MKFIFMAHTSIEVRIQKMTKFLLSNKYSFSMNMKRRQLKFVHVRLTLILMIFHILHFFTIYFSANMIFFFYVTTK